MSSGQIRIVLADDHWLMRDEMRRIFGKQPNLKIVGEAEDGYQALELVKNLQPDVLLLDLRMPKMSGVDVMRKIRELSLTVKTLVLTAYDDDDYILALVGAGAQGYLLKTAREAELVDAVKRVCAGEIVLDPAVAAKMAHHWTRQQQAAGPVESLSTREREIIQLVATGLRNKAIAETLHISDRTVEGHLNNIFSKLGVSSRLEAVLYALSQRLVTIGEEETR